jgi:hypothetical protein
MITRSQSPFSAVSQTVRQLRATIERGFSEITRLEPRLSRLALNEAEALAWQSGYPLLVFPVLAEEKLRALMAWRDYQASIRRVNPAPGSGARWQPEVARYHRNRRRVRVLTPTRSGRLASLAALMMTLLLLATGCNQGGRPVARPFAGGHRCSRDSAGFGRVGRVHRPYRGGRSGGGATSRFRPHPGSPVSVRPVGRSRAMFW